VSRYCEYGIEPLDFRARRRKSLTAERLLAFCKGACCMELIGNGIFVKARDAYS
jgi:hypothetical protein